LKVLLALALPGRQAVVELSLPAGSTVGEAIAAARREGLLDGVEVAGMRTGVWSRPCAEDTILREGDRVELYRPLAADPKDMRRARSRKPARG
jgi:putative ubiquitin-RnfH superfamily antitoxin RatB of RatAB toxin-antitoxin module